MKKLLAVLSAGVLAAAMCAGFVACGGNGDTDFSKIVSDKITEEQWNEIFALDKNGLPVSAENFKYVYKVISLDSDYESWDRYEVSVDGNKVYAKVSGYTEEDDMGKYSIEMYALLTDDGNYISYYLEDGVWAEGDSDSEGDKVYHRMPFSSSGAYQDKDDLKHILVPFSSFEYSEEKKGYVRTTSSDYEYGDEITYIIKFQNGKYRGSERYVDGKLNWSIVVYDYGKAHVTLPKVSE